MLASRARPCVSQFNKFIVPLRARYSSATEKQYEFLKVSVPRTGVGMSKNYLNNNNPQDLSGHT
jgi:enoyl-CoA hydratase